MPERNLVGISNPRTEAETNVTGLSIYGTLMGCRYVGRKLAMVIVVIMCFGLVSATCWAVAKEQPKVTDQQITNAVDHRLLSDSALKNNPIDVRTDDGIVTLSGTANHLIAKERATMLAQTIRGVRGVVNTISLRIPSLPDEEVRKNVEAAFYFDAATDSYELKTAVKDGIVTLNGTVQSYREKQLAVYVAKGVKGVKEVKDSITVSTRSKRPDVEIAAEVRNIIAIDAWLNPYLININVKDGVVTLIGEVGSLAQKERARVLAWTAGVKTVNSDGLLIEPWANAKDQRKVTDTLKSDPQIKQAVHDSFVFDPRVWSFNPNVEVKNGAVTLSGVVNNLKAKRSAEQDAKNTVGVRRVKNLLKVRPSKPIADDKIALNVISAFFRDPVLDSFEIAVKSMHGMVTLTGTVDSFFEKAEAEDVASRTKGVIDVKSHLKVSYPSVADYYGGYDPYWSFPSQVVIIEEFQLVPIPYAEPTPEKMKYCESMDIEFDINKADIRPQYHDEVAKVGDFMKANSTTTAVIAGYADEVGSDDYNMKLSQRRAESVVKYLENNFGIDPSRLSTKGYGKTRPIADNTTNAGKQKNRRIDAIIDCALKVKDIASPPARLCMTLKVEFASDSADIAQQYYDEVNSVGEYMNKYPTTTTVIEGHTDNVGGHEYNMKLSQRRAEKAVKYLVDKFSIDQSRLSAKGYGSTRRIAYNNTPEGRQKNRRINAIIDCVIKK